MVLGVSVDRNEQTVPEYCEALRRHLSPARDPEENINYRYGTYKIPESYIIDRNGKVVRKYAGLPERERRGELVDGSGAGRLREVIAVMHTLLTVTPFSKSTSCSGRAGIWTARKTWRCTSTMAASTRRGRNW